MMNSIIYYLIDYDLLDVVIETRSREKSGECRINNTNILSSVVY